MRVALIAICVSALLLALAEPAEAADIRSGDTLLIGSSETINDDLYLFGNTITILGAVHGDVFAGGNSIDIEGPITGSISVAGNSVTIRGPVSGSVRVAGNILSVDGKIAGDLLAAGSALNVGSAGRVGRDLVLATGSATLVGETGRDVRGSAGNLAIDGHVGGKVDVEVTALRLTDRAVVDGGIDYGATNDANVSPSAKVTGGIRRHEPRRTQPVAPSPTPTSMLLDWIRNLVGVLILGFLMLAIVPEFVRRATDRLEHNPLASVGLGAAVLIGVPVLALLAFIIGAIVGGWWIGFVALALYVVALAVSVPIVSLAIGEWIMSRVGGRREPAIALIVGAALLLVIGIVPAIGGLIVFLAALSGIGGIALSLGQREAAPAAAR